MTAARLWRTESGYGKGDWVRFRFANYLKTYDVAAHELTVTMVRDVLYNTGITATTAIGTDLYLAEVAKSSSPR